MVNLLELNATASSLPIKRFELDEEFFMIFDYMKNFDYFDMHPKGDIPTPADAISVRILLTKLSQYGNMVEKNG